MADFVVTIALERLADVVQRQIQEEVDLVRGVRKEVDYLSSKLNTIRNVLEDAERRRYKDKTIQSWLNKLEDVSYDIDDVLDEWNFAALKLQIEGKVATRRDIAKKIKELKERLSVILNEKDEFSFIVNQPVNAQESTRDRSTSLVDVSDIHGREKDRDVLVSKLMLEVAGKQSGPDVISIVGTGGIGKTTLAQLVYNDDRLVSCFELRIWVCVSDVFDGIRIAKAILESVAGRSSGLNELSALLTCLKNSISGKKFLLVLDDIWTEDYSKWEPFKNSLNCGSPGTLSGRNEENYEELQKIGKKVAEKCKGLPLVAKVLGSLLRLKDTTEEWENILDNEIWQLEEAEVDLFPHLFLSYNELSPTMKQCFSYCAMFPKDWRIDVKKLIRMWMALGYLGSTGSTTDLELKGKEYFNNLRMRSFFQDFEDYGDIIYCKMHDIVHDFAQFLRKTKNHNQTDTKLDARTNSSLVTQVKVYRTLFCQKKVPCELFDFATPARVLSLCGCKLQDTPRGVDDLIHLRYLDLSDSHGLTALVFRTICQLYNLQILDLHLCGLKEIPREIGKLINLRYLDLSDNQLETEVPQTIHQLHNLQTLCLTNCNLKEIPTGIGDLIGLRNLDLRNNKLQEIPKEIGNLIELRNLDMSNNELKEIPREVGNLIELRNLDMSNNKLKEIPTEIGNLIRLRNLDLRSNKDIKELPETMCNLCDLQNLNLVECERFSRLPEGIERLVSLRHLRYSDSSILYQIPQGLEKLTGLQTLRVFYAGRGCSKLGYLKELDQLSGYLRLMISLDDREDVDEARKAKLMNKKHIEEMEIVFTDAMGRTEEDELLRNEALEALQPPPNLRHLMISCYQGTKFPGWINSSFNHLRSLQISGNNYISTLPCLGKLPNLQYLYVLGMERLKLVGREFLGIAAGNVDGSMPIPCMAVSFPKLEILIFMKCSQWEEWEDIEDGSTTMSIMPCLRILKITRCGLTELPHRLLRKASSLQYLTIYRSFNLLERYGVTGSGHESLSHIPHVSLLY
ncbi:putative disease resistance protein RGA1 [Sesamum angolense]|uniref:Disease resistance protein RGA1 n=1 Tax=Sesamum angolense TaxID=2727404 RepID=A0AAE1WKS6_9LAMI|nr:putative disease resistance protein RGA1 [Sesamum angolense]